MTRINTVDPIELTDQHLMAEYRELPMVMAAARRSDPLKYVPSTVYTLNKGHVKFFFNKKCYLLGRWMVLIKELEKRGFNINPSERIVHWNSLDKFKQVDWWPTSQDQEVNRKRLEERVSLKPTWYRYYGQPIKK